IAEIAHMTTNSFCRFFKKQTGKSFSQFLNEVRVNNAIRLLTHEDIYVSEVCFKVGYNSVTNFYKQFKKITGTSPKDYVL
ncbi:MAG: AraC family transcriptional regulator, partial [Bacteroidetes bacterium]